MERRFKFLNEIPELRNFTEYAVDTDGNVWSFKNNKQRKLKTNYKKKINDKCYGSCVNLTNKEGERRNISVQQLMSLAFLPKQGNCTRVRHLNGNLHDNRLENLEWIIPKPRKKDKEKVNNNTYVIDRFILDKIRQVYFASIKKGLPVPDSNTFFNTIVESALESYIMQYGLRRLMQ
jgi:hypothetical protein